MNKIKKFFIVCLMCTNFFFFFLQQCAGTSLLDSWGLELAYRVTTGSTARTEVHMPIIQHMGGQDSSWIPWSVVLDPTGPMNTFLVGEKQIAGGGRYK